MLTRKIVILLIAFRIVMNPAQAIVGDGGAGWANAITLAKILTESIKNYEQLKTIAAETHEYREYLKAINQGIDNSLGLINALPIRDERVLEGLKNYQISLKTVEKLYGIVPKSSQASTQLLHDQTVAESLKMISAINEYGQNQEENALRIAGQARQASPKGAARMNVEVNAQILHSLNQLIRINGQMLKLHSQTLAMNNKENKDSIGGLIKMKKDFRNQAMNFEKFHNNFNLPRF